MKVKHITQYLFESFKDAQAKFAQEASEDEVKQYLDTFKQLAKKGTVSGQEKDIGYWIKQGWNEFKGFVDEKSQEKSKSEVKKSKKKDSIIAHEDEEKMVVIPLSKDASCYYGANTKWCTAASKNENHFLKYFYLHKKVLFYVIMKNTNKKYAVSSSFINEDEVKYFDDMDLSISEDNFKDKTGISEEQIVVWYNKNKPIINKAMDLNNVSEDIQIELYEIDNSIIERIKHPPLELQYKTIAVFGIGIKYINNPSEEVQLEALNKGSPALIIKHINNPTERVQLEAVKRDGAAIEFIEDPSEKVQFEAVIDYPPSIQFIDNPSEEIQLKVVKRNYQNIKYIDNPTDKVKQLYNELQEQ